VLVLLSEMLPLNKVPKLQKSFLRERRVSSEATKVVPKGMQSLNTTEIEGKKAPKSFLRGCRA
jgi:hypothetical protein